jgi:two-component system, NarL family, invasion response regulator UvrY
MTEKVVKVVLADDHVLLRNGLAGLVTNFGYTVLFECNNGKDLVDKLDKNNLPDIVLMDINMPEMDGYETAAWLRKNYPLVNVLALTMKEDEDSIIRMIRNGAKGYILKDETPEELKYAIESVLSKGFYYSQVVTGRLVHSIHQMDDTDSHTRQVMHLNDREIEFLKLAASELTYKEIAAKMHLSPRTIDGYRDALFERLHLKNRVGLIIYAIKHGIVDLD